MDPTKAQAMTFPLSPTFVPFQLWGEMERNSLSENVRTAQYENKNHETCLCWEGDCARGIAYRHQSDATR
jgi:hypothetical protein